MNDLRIVKEEFSEKLIAKLIPLSVLWEKEGNCNGIVANTIEDFLDKDIYVAYDDDIIVGYLLATSSKTKKGNCMIPQGSKVYYIDELYVIESYRNKGIGKKLFEFAEMQVNNKYDFIDLVTSTKDYKKILHFYIDEMGMTFFNAYLIKKLKEKNHVF